MKPVDPYCQGDLDGLCGLYAIINALCALCPEIDEDIASGLFGHLARHIQLQRLKEPMPIIAYGIGSTSLRLLLERALRFVRKNLGIEIELVLVRMVFQVLEPPLQLQDRFFKIERLGFHSVKRLRN